MFKKLFFWFLVLILPSNLFAQSIDLEKSIDKLMEQWNKKDSPGAAIGVVKDGKLIFAKGYGNANIEYDIPISPSTVFHIASVSKQFTCFAITMLADQGKLSLNDDIRKYLPEIPDFGKTITIKHLIYHTSGLRDQWNLLALAGWRLDDVITREHVLKLVRNQKELNSTPGEVFNYCNTGYTLLAEIVSRISGKSFSEWTQENMFKPLDMTNTLFYDDHEKVVKNRAYSFNPSHNGSFQKAVLSYANVGATSLFTTVEDLAKWSMNFEKPVIGNSNIIKQMEERGILNNGDTINYAFGQNITTYKGLKMIEHGGGDAGFRTHLARFPEQNYSVIVLSNYGPFDPYKMAMQITDIVLADKLKNEVKKDEPKKDNLIVDVKEEILKSYVGEYNLAPGFSIAITFEDKKLMGQGTGQPKFHLLPKSESSFFLKDYDIQVDFEKDEVGDISRLILHQNGNDMPALKIREEKPKVSLDEYTGDYYSEELGTTYTFVLKDNKLVATHRRHDDIGLTIGGKDEFTGMSWFFNNIKFQRNVEGKIISCRISSGRVKNVLFDKK